MRNLGIFLVLGVAQCASLGAAQVNVSVKDQSGRPVNDAVLLAVPADPKVALRAQAQTDSVDQVEKQFVPYVKVIFLGSTIRFPNSDNIRHQVYSFSPAKKFELPLYAGSAALPVLFDRPGVVVLGCNIHDWMIGYVYVSDTPFFTKTGKAGTATFADLPPGEYAMRVWQPSMVAGEQSTVQRVVVSSDAGNQAEWTIKVKATVPVPRVSSGAAPAYP